MKKRLFVLMVAIAMSLCSQRALAQSNEVVQLLLNVEKLAQFKQILSDMKKGYDIVSKGYNTVKDLSEGNFNIHKAFIDGLFEASPAVKGYYKVSQIINYQIALVKEYRQAYERFRNSNLLNPTEIGYIGNVYSNLLNQSLRNLDELSNVVTSGKLQMSDDERLKAIDGIYAELEDELSFLRSFNSSTSILMLQRQKEQKDLKGIEKLYNLK